jgi:uncharacterized protein YqgC (DUF456 family)
MPAAEFDQFDVVKESGNAAAGAGAAIGAVAGSFVAVPIWGPTLGATIGFASGMIIGRIFGKRERDAQAARAGEAVHVQYLAAYDD